MVTQPYGFDFNGYRASIPLRLFRKRSELRVTLIRDSCFTGAEGRGSKAGSDSSIAAMVRRTTRSTTAAAEARSASLTFEAPVSAGSFMSFTSSIASGVSQLFKKADHSRSVSPISGACSPRECGASGAKTDDAQQEALAAVQRCEEARAKDAQAMPPPPPRVAARPADAAPMIYVTKGAQPNVEAALPLSKRKVPTDCEKSQPRKFSLFNSKRLFLAPPLPPFLAPQASLINSSANSSTI